MIRQEPDESDWKKFRALVPELRERYLRNRNTELIAILQGELLTPAERFWNASERIKEIGGILRTCLDDLRRSKMIHVLILMHRHQMIADEDLDGFSEELRKRITTQTDLQKEFAQQDGAVQPPISSEFE